MTSSGREIKVSVMTTSLNRSEEAWPQEELLNSIESVAKHVEQIISSSSSLCIYGAGTNGTKIARYLKCVGLHVSLFVDDVKSCVMDALDGVRVLSFQDAKLELKGALVLVSMFSPKHSFARTAEQIEAVGATAISILQFYAWMGSDYGPFYFVGSSRSGADMLAGLRLLRQKMISMEAVARLEHHISFLMSLDPRQALEPSRDYFAHVHHLFERNPIFVDGGAYDGDTIEQFVAGAGDRFSKILAFEPDPLNFERLSNNIGDHFPETRARIHLYNAALWESTGRGFFSSEGNASSSLTEDGASCSLLSLDSITNEPGPYLIKLDIEGAEEAAIRGMASIIRAQNALVMACIYHSPDQIWEVARQILKINDDYKFDLHAHGYDGADLVLYAIPPELARRQ